MKQQKKKGTTLYRQMWGFIVFIEVMFVFVMYCGYTTVAEVLEAADPSSFIRHYTIFCVVLFVILAIGITLFAFAILTKIRKGFKVVTDATVELADGNVDIKLESLTKDEFGQLIEKYITLVETSREQAAIAEAVASGDMTISITPRSRKDKLGNALLKMVTNTDHSLSNIRDSAYQVSTSSSEVASASESLAQGSTEQASAIQQITASIDDVAKKTKENAQESMNAAELVEKTIENVKIGNGQMQEMMEAMQEINASSESISKIIKVIDDIAFQTNILALNAAVEAARAGEAGKGFAVVAEEVRNLAAKSAQAAAETAELIEDSIKKVGAGSQIAEKTAKALEEITMDVQQSGEIITGIAEASNYQATAIAQIDQAIEQVSQVVQTNSATSEECAAASIELSNQAARMRELLAVYKLSEQTAYVQDYAQRTGDEQGDFVSKEDANEQIISLGEGFGKY
ncbi:MAG: methyl-accepting chemotaxis protein [Agathobacter sp.]